MITSASLKVYLRELEEKKITEVEFLEMVSLTDNEQKSIGSFYIENLKNGKNINNDREAYSADSLINYRRNQAALRNGASSKERKGLKGRSFHSDVSSSK